ncbi:MAG: tetratricopeptide repeat protein [Saprospiraceae bacterium]|nr:tetratricopeptide repeat protein [Saprospiraceae bacterium]
MPYPLTHDYYPRHITMMNFADWRVLLSIATYGLLIFFMVKNWQKRSLLSFGIAFYLITLSIVSNLSITVGTNMAERFVFMPSVGFCIVLAFLLEKLGQIFNLKNVLSHYLLVAIVVAFGAKTVLRNLAWKDDYTLFTTDIRTSGNSAKLLTSVAGKTIERFMDDKTELRAIKIEQAIRYLERAVSIHRYKNPYLLLGNAHLYLEHFDDAIKNYETALSFDPNFGDAKNNLAIAYREGGKYYGQIRNDIGKAVQYFTKSLSINPNDGQVYSYLGTCYGIAAQYEKSAEVLEKALALRFDKRDAENLSLSYRNIGDAEKAAFWAKKSKNE